MCGCRGSVPTQNSLPWKWGVGDGRLDLREADELTLCLLVPELILHSLLLLCKLVQVSCSWPPAAPEERKAVLLSTGEGIICPSEDWLRHIVAPLVEMLVSHSALLTLHRLKCL